MFNLINTIDVHNKKSWQDEIFLTFDIDWCSDDVLSHVLDIIENENIKATFFATHETGLLKRMRDNPNIELGIHPNFNFLLNGDFRQGKNIDEVVKYYMDIIPEATSSRSHSVTHNSHILESLVAHGVRSESNTLIPFSANSYMEPWLYWNRLLTRIPYFWEDDVHYFYRWRWSVEEFMQYKGIKVFDFHPIHVFLNMETIDRYENARDCFQNFSKLKKYVNKNVYGTRDFLMDLIKKGKRK